MSLFISLLVILLITYGVLFNKTKFLVVISILSLFADIFRVNLGASLLFINIVGFLLIPQLILYYRDNFNNGNVRLFKKIISPLWINFLYLIVLGFIFGFIFPWTDSSSYRSWGQNAQGRTIITLIRYFNEFVVAFYIFILLASKKINFRFIINCIGWITVISFSFGVFGLVFGALKIDLSTLSYRSSDRFLGLNGEPKIMGRNSALSYAVLLLYYLKIKKEKKLLYFIVISAVGVILSLSASAIVLFLAFNLYIIIVQKNIKLIITSTVIFIGSIFILQTNKFFVDRTQKKIEKAVFGTTESSDSFAMTYMSRFDIFDHLALLFLYDNPQYLISGTGPNLISIPASSYLADFTKYSFYEDLGGIDSVPNVLLNNVLANSGILGVILYAIFFIRLYKYSRIDTNGISKNLVVVALLLNMVYFSIFLLFITGIIAGNLALVSQNKKRRTKVLKINKLS